MYLWNSFSPRPLQATEKIIIKSMYRRIDRGCMLFSRKVFEKSAHPYRDIRRLTENILFQDNGLFPRHPDGFQMYWNPDWVETELPAFCDPSSSSRIQWDIVTAKRAARTKSSRCNGSNVESSPNSLHIILDWIQSLCFYLQSNGAYALSFWWLKACNERVTARPINVGRSGNPFSKIAFIRSFDKRYDNLDT